MIKSALLNVDKSPQHFHDPNGDSIFLVLSLGAGDLLITGGTSRKLHVWNTQSHTLTHTTPTLKGWINSGLVVD
jgi:hypothetical protein